MRRREFVLLSLAALSAPAARADDGGVGFTVERDRLRLRSALFDGAPCTAVFDTGAAISTVTEAFAAERGLTSSRTVRIRTAGGELRAPIVRGRSFSADGRGLSPARWAVMPAVYDWGADCLLGVGDIDDYSLAFSTERLGIGRSPRSGAPLALLRASPSPIITFTAGGVAANLVFDSGADRTSVDTATGEALAAVPGAKTHYYRTVAGRSLRAVRVPELASGQTVFRDLLFHVRPGEISLSKVRVSGLFGVDNMRCYDWAVHKRERALLRLAELPDRPQRIGLGIDVRIDDGGSVLGLAEGGPAEQAGLTFEDRIVSMNDVPADLAHQAAFALVGSCNCLEDVRVVAERGGVRRTLVIRTAPLI